MARKIKTVFYNNKEPAEKAGSSSKRKRKVPEGMTAEERAAFRKTKAWTGMRKDLKEERQVDELTLMPLNPRYNLHHKNMSNITYSDIRDKNHFSCLNKKSHTDAHDFFVQLKKKKIGGINYVFRFLKLQLEMAKLNLAKEDYEAMLAEFDEQIMEKWKELKEHLENFN